LDHKIYFIQEANNGAIKIGYSGNPEARRVQLQTGNPRELVIIGVMSGDADLEKELHQRFSTYRIRCEWFQPASEIMDFVHAYCLQSKVNVVSLLPGGKCRITFYEPVRASWRLFFIVGTYREVGLLGHENSELLYGIEGPCDTLEVLLSELGVEEQALEEFRMALSVDPL
jgi:hypothetical protein